MANPMQGLLNDPMFMSGAGILANNTGHYGAFAPAVGKGLLMGGNQMRKAELMKQRQQELELRKQAMAFKMKPQPYTLSPGSVRYGAGGQPISYNPSRGTAETPTEMEKLLSLRNQFPVKSSDYNAVQSRIDKLGTVVGRTEFDRGGLTKAQYGEKVQREEAKQDAVRLIDEILEDLDSPEVGTTLFAPQRKVVSGLIGGAGESLNIPEMQEAAKWVSPKKLEGIGTKGTLLVGTLKEPIMKERRMSDSDRIVLEDALMVLNSAASKEQIRTALQAAKGVMQRSTPRKEGEEWVGRDGKKRKLVDGKIKVWVE